MVACMQVGDPFDVQSACLTSPEQRVAQKAKAVQLRRKFSYGSGSDLVAARNAYAGCLGAIMEDTKKVGVNMARMQCFRNEGADIAERLLAFLSDASPAHPPCWTRSEPSGPISQLVQPARSPDRDQWQETVRVLTSGEQ